MPLDNFIDFIFTDSPQTAPKILGAVWGESVKIKSIKLSNGIYSALETPFLKNPECNSRGGGDSLSQITLFGGIAQDFLFQKQY